MIVYKTIIVTPAKAQYIKAAKFNKMLKIMHNRMMQYLNGDNQYIPGYLAALRDVENLVAICSEEIGK